MSLQFRPLARLAVPKPLSTMFEEDFERCFICQQACKGLYCSSECRTRDKGITELPAKTAPVQLTSQLPLALSPMVRPHHAIHPFPSPRMPPHGHTDSSSSSSITSSPIQSPLTNPAAGDSPRKEAFDLPPPAYPSSHMPFPGSVPVKIPNLASAPASRYAHTPAAPASPHTHSSTNAAITATGSSTPYHGTSIDTLRFGRKPSLINSVTSPNALIARCACGKPANHASRPSSRDRQGGGGGGDSDFARLSLGPSVLAPQPHGKRISSDSHPRAYQQDTDRRAVSSGYNTPDPSGAAGGSFGASLLSRSRSDPIPPALHARKAAPGRAGASASTVEHGAPSSVISPKRRSDSRQGRPHVEGMSRTGSSSGSGAVPASGGMDARGRSRERVKHAVESTAPTLLNHPPEREVAPSRSRHRLDERSRRPHSGNGNGNSNSNNNGNGNGQGHGSDAQRGTAGTTSTITAAHVHAHASPSLPPLEAAPIMPSLIHRGAPQIGAGGEGIAPTPRRKGSPKKDDE